MLLLLLLLQEVLVSRLLLGGLPLCCLCPGMSSSRCLPLLLHLDLARRQLLLQSCSAGPFVALAPHDSLLVLGQLLLQRHDTLICIPQLLLCAGQCSTAGVQLLLGGISSRSSSLCCMLQSGDGCSSCG